MLTNTQLVDYCKAQLGKPYWFGTFGLYPTEALWNNKAKQYPKYYSDTRKKKASKVFGTGAKNKTHDCIGLYKGALWSADADAEAKYNPAQDKDADTYFKSIASDKKGDIASIPEVIGLGLWRKGHFGIYIGGGYLIEAKGFDYGVVKSKLSERDFTHWMYLGEIIYNDTAKPSEAKSESNKAISEGDADREAVYIVKKGDTLSKIASLFKTTVDAIAKRNNIQNVNLIRVGQTLIIGGKAQPTSPNVMTATVTTNGDVLNVRTMPNGTIIDTLSNGTVVDVEKVEGDWVKLANRSGYCFKKYLKING